MTLQRTQHWVNIIRPLWCVCCRRAWCDSVTQRSVRCLCSVLHHWQVHRRHTQSTRWTYSRRRNERSQRHCSLPPWSSTVRRRRELLYLASVSWWSLVREVAADWVNNAHIPRLVTVADVTTSLGDVTRASWSTSIQHDRQTTPACRCVSALHGVAESRSWNDTSDVCRLSLGHITGQGAAGGAVGGEWTV